ncbi:exosortase F system-associated membrane protein [Urechidicola vernalis]|uniref:Exosortase F system-associated protein n=1 Tax=Urechidicola vernalis TaxID=3075600 RepID=A0ABU2Y528_9FLAO|nr:exosortase F system-associated protein [Urechidicola sp. P050]MDT0553265.1 exosortase F system-associated protein [Urechidicola sp. P050]
MKKVIRYSVIAILFLLLFFIRGFEDVLFYDPFLLYFENDYLLAEFPSVDMWKLFLSILFRFSLNSIVSVLILKFVFSETVQLKFLIWLYIVFFIVCVSVFLIQVQSEFDNGYLFPFYVRRLLIHPMLLIVLLPVYFVKRNR